MKQRDQGGWVESGLDMARKARARDIALAALLFLAIEPCRITSYPLAARCSLGSWGRGGPGGFGRAEVRASGIIQGRCGLPFQSRTGSCNNVVLVPRWQCGRTIARAGDMGGGDSQDGGEGQVAETGTATGDYEEKMEEGGDGQRPSLQVGSAGENEMASTAVRITLPLTRFEFSYALCHLIHPWFSTLNLMPPLIPLQPPVPRVDESLPSPVRISFNIHFYTSSTAGEGQSLSSRP